MNSPLPHSLEAEQSILGEVLTFPEQLSKIRAIVNADDFHNDAHAVIFDVMCTLADREIAPDLIAVADALRGLHRADNLTVKHGDAYLPKLMEMAIGAGDALHHARLVKEKAVCRQVMETAQDAFNLASSGDVSLLTAKNGHLNLSALVASASGGTVTDKNPFACNVMRASSLPPAQPPVRLWFGFYPRSVVFFVGESGAGKSSVLYNFAIHAARNEPLYGNEFGAGRPLRILYIDPENSGNFAEGHGGQCSVKVERIAQGKPKDLYFHTGEGVDLSRKSHIDALAAYIKQERFDVVILDPVSNLFATRDENDNAEAAKQMTSLTTLSRETGACIVPVHHTGHSQGNNMGRGASARFAAADVAFVFRARGSEDEEDDTFTGATRQREDVCRLQIVKNRLEGRGSLYLQMAGEDRFNLSTFAAWKGRVSSSSEGSPKSAQADTEIRLFLSDEQWHSRTDILDAMKLENIGQVATDSALKKLEESNTIQSKRQGRGGSLHYALSFLVSQSPKESEKLKNLDEPSFMSISDDENNDFPMKGN